MNTLIFDCDGVLSDTERYGHLPAFNQTFEEFNLPVKWSEAEYGIKLKIGGGKERMASLISPAFIAAAGLSSDPEAQQLAVAQWHKRKTAIYVDLVKNGQLPGRPGIARIVRDALASGWTLAVASTSAQESVQAILDHAVGQANAARFAGVFAGDIVPNKKPAPDIYTLAVKHTGADPRNTIVIEDSRNGLLAATRAGLQCIVTVNDYTINENFDEAALVVSALGDPTDAPIAVLANRCGADVGDFVTLRDLVACMSK